VKRIDKLVKIYSGTEVTVILLKGRIEEIGINSTVKNDYKSGVEAGFVGGVQSAVDLFIQLSDFERAEPIIRDFISKNRS
jgi:Putative prokaryotic signal transducing protein